jgi:hypothetical protein
MRDAVEEQSDLVYAKISKLAPQTETPRCLS